MIQRRICKSNGTSRGLDLECVVLLKVRIFFFFSGRWEVAMLH